MTAVLIIIIICSSISNNIIYLQSHVYIINYMIVQVFMLHCVKHPVISAKMLYYHLRHISSCIKLYLIIVDIQIDSRLHT